MSWIARAKPRTAGDEAKAAEDLLRAADLLDRQGALEQSKQIRQVVGNCRTIRPMLPSPAMDWISIARGCIIDPQCFSSTCA